jgi:hypothetical protein
MPTETSPSAGEIVTRIEEQLRERGIDVLLMLSREDSDPVVGRILDAHVVAQTAFFFTATGQHIVLTGRTDAMAYEIFPFFSEIIAFEGEFSEEFARVFDRLAPKKVALNISEDDAELDGLRWGLYTQLQEIIGAERLSAIEVSSAEVLRHAL